jgi:hypothetical protein
MGSTNTQNPLAFLSTAVGTLNGLLVSIPAASSFNPTQATALAVALTIAGGAVGYKRRHSRPFLYFALVCALVLIVIISSATGLGV